MTQSRTHNCGELRLADAGKTVTLAGWLENMREVGSNLAFVVLRDFYGTTQVVIESEEMMQAFKPINRESTISVTGVVRERTSKNPKQPTGEIEVVPESVSVLGRCRYNALPFEINRSKEADENQRLKYRYLDLRNPAGQEEHHPALRMSWRTCAAGMTERGFLEITTPILTSFLARRRARLSRPGPQPSRQVLCSAAGSAAVQAAAHDLRLRPLFPDRAVLPR